MIEAPLLVSVMAVKWDARKGKRQDTMWVVLMAVKSEKFSDGQQVALLDAIMGAIKVLSLSLMPLGSMLADL